jgi:hypothetical protein
LDADASEKKLFAVPFVCNEFLNFGYSLNLENDKERERKKY